MPPSGNAFSNRDGVARAQVDVLQRALEAGGRELGCTEEAVRLLKMEVRKLRWERQLLARNIAAMPRLEQELYHAVQVR